MDMKADIETPSIDAQYGEASRSPRRLRTVLMIAGPLLVVAVVLVVYSLGGRYQKTDDASVKAARVAISANVSGRVQELDVRDNQLVHKGDVLFRLDAAPLQIALEEASARLAAARLQVETLKANYRQRLAELKSARETAAYQQSEYVRQRRLLVPGISSQLQVDRDLHTLQEAQAQIAGIQQEISGVAASLGGDPVIDPSRHPSVQQAQAVLDRAALDLSYAVVTAPSDGVVTRVEQLQVGTYIAASTPVFALVSNNDVWVEADFKEDQMTYVRVGQHASVHIDAYPGKQFEARVASISPGTGAEFSLLPPENATGNWVKVVQRVPVRLTFDRPESAYPMQDGLSAGVSVDTHFKRRLFGSDSVAAR